MVKLIDEATGRVLVARLEIARSMGARMRGLLGRAGLQPDCGMLIEDCSSIHTWFMKFPLDVMFLDKDMKAVKVVRNLTPWRMAMAWGASAVVEAAAGEADRWQVRVGDRLRIVEEA